MRATARRDPLDRWSERVIGALAARLGAAGALPLRRPALAALHRLGAARAAKPGSRPSACSSTPARALRLLPRRAGLPGAARPAAARPRGPATPAPRPASTACPVGALAGGRLRRRRLPRLSRYRAGPGLPHPRLRRAPRLPGRRRAAARGPIGLPHGRLSWQADAMRRLILMRHAKSSWADPGQRDLDRPLNKRGRRAAGADRRLAEGARATGPGRRSSPAPAAPRRPGPAWWPRPAPPRRAYVPEIYHAGARGAARGPARAPTRTACWCSATSRGSAASPPASSPMRLPTPPSTSFRPARPPSSTSTPTPGRRLAGERPARRLHRPQPARIDRGRSMSVVVDAARAGVALRGGIRREKPCQTRD